MLFNIFIDTIPQTQFLLVTQRNPFEIFHTAINTFYLIFCYYTLVLFILIQNLMILLKTKFVIHLIYLYL